MPPTDPDNSDEIELTCRLRRQDPEALAALYDRYAPFLYSLLLRITRDAAISQDLLQEVFLKVWTRAVLFDGQRGSLRVWLGVVARNLALDQQRSAHWQWTKHRSTELPLDYGDGVDPEPTWQRCHWLARVLQALPLHEKKVLELAYFSGYSQTEIAQLLGEPLGTVKSWIRAALTHSRIKMADVGDSPPHPPGPKSWVSAERPIFFA